ncbi:hypothetical protein [Clostridium perfringens]|uniref:hypothetical protein n=1 Tax=Clostridium perfringens TaxID=1502 RepID=UPI00078DD5EB|nr:hypothetical protein [Clostridium perfringens]AMN30795.1 hypothetical protein JFP55_pH0007 [Clostridium perfringens]MDM0935716.1 hypothetical protein [Clostridium perfringens]
MKYKNIKVEEVLIEFQNYLKIFKDDEKAFDYFADLIEDKLEDDAYIDFVSNDIIQIRFEKETNKGTFKYVVDFYKKYIEYNKNITNFCDVKFILELEDFLISENGKSYNSEEFTFDELKNNDEILKMTKLDIEDNHFKFIKINTTSKENNFEGILKDIENKIFIKGNPILIIQDQDKKLYSIVEKVLLENNYSIEVLKSKSKDNESILKNIFNDKFLKNSEVNDKKAIFFECEDINNECIEILDIYYMIVDKELKKDVIFYMDTNTIPPVSFENPKIYKMIFTNYNSYTEEKE